MGNGILIVDDQPGIRLLLSEILLNTGCPITSVGTGKDALERLEKHTYKLVVIDYLLPIISGLEVIKYIQQNLPELPVILMSGLVDEIKQEEENYNVIKGLLFKPFDVSEVYALANQLLEQPDSNL